MMRHLPLAVLGACGVTFTLFYGMQAMIAPDGEGEYDRTQAPVFDFIRYKSEETTRTRSRVRPKPPKEEPLPRPMPKIALTTPDIRPQMQAMPMPKLDLDLRLSADTLGAGITNVAGSREMDIIPLVRIPPVYPRQALAKRKEGYVKVGFVITKEGLVKAPYVVEAEPQGLFESAALNAIRRWKFKPRLENGRAVEHNGIQVLEFKLNKE